MHGMMNSDKHAVIGTILSRSSDVLMFACRRGRVAIVIVGKQEVSNTAEPESKQLASTGSSSGGRTGTVVVVTYDWLPSSLLSNLQSCEAVRGLGTGLLSRLRRETGWGCASIGTCWGGVGLCQVIERRNCSG